MKLIRNAFTLISQPSVAMDYLRYRLSRARNGGEAVRIFPQDRLMIGGLSGFGEFHSCAHFINPAERQFLTEFPFGDGPIFDVGGNLGIFSLLLARRFPDRIIHAFEPNPSTFKSMRANFERNQCLHAQAHAVAIAANEGETSFMADPVDRATTHLVMDDQSDTPTVRVPCMKLDTFIEKEGIDQVGLLKVDVEGYEELVFRGAERLLASGRAKVIYYEVCPELTHRAGFAPDAPGRLLLASGYRLHVLDDDGKLRPANLDRIPSVNLENWVAIRT